jgi:hypothetical protein
MPIILSTDSNGLPVSVELSPNLIAYYELWKKTLRQNRSEVEAEIGALDLTKSKIECIKRGMPDLPPNIESAIFDIAFRLHSERDHGPIGSMTPTWATFERRHLSCMCFWDAKKIYDEQEILKTCSPVTDEDLHYELRYE